MTTTVRLTIDCETHGPDRWLARYPDGTTECFFCALEKHFEERQTKRSVAGSCLVCVGPLAVEGSVYCRSCAAKRRWRSELARGASKSYAIAPSDRATRR